MVRLIGLICVFGIASFSLAAFIHAPTACARRVRRVMCPCWPDGLTELESKLGAPDTIDIEFSADPCDTRPETRQSEGPCPDFRSDTAQARIEDVENPHSTPHAVAVAQFTIYRNTTQRAECDLIFNHIEQSERGITVSEAQECMQDINAYCRDYCMAHPDSDPCVQ